MKPVAGAVYYLAGILLKPATKQQAQRLINQGFRLATKGMKDSKVPIHKITDSNIVTYITRAIKAAKELRKAPKLDPKTGRPISNNKKGSGGSTMTTAGGRGQSALGRRLALSKLKNRGKVGPTKSAAKKPLAAPKRVPDKITTPTTSVPKRLAQGLNIVAAGGIAKVAYDAYKDNEAANKKFEEARRARSDLSTAKDKRSLARKVRAAKNVAVARENKVAAEKKLDQQVTKMLSKSPKEQAEAADTPARKKAIMRALKEAMDFQSDKNKGK